MRDFLDGILETIGAESLTDDELLAMNPFTADPGDYVKEIYDKLHDALSARESVSSVLEKLKALFYANGYETDEAAKRPVSSIFIGAAL